MHHEDHLFWAWRWSYGSSHRHLLSERGECGEYAGPLSSWQLLRMLILISHFPHITFLWQGIDGNVNDTNKSTRVVLKEMFLNMKDKSV